MHYTHASLSIHKTDTLYYLACGVPELMHRLILALRNYHCCSCIKSANFSCFLQHAASSNAPCKLALTQYISKIHIVEKKRVLFENRPALCLCNYIFITAYIIHIF